MNGIPSLSCPRSGERNYVPTDLAEGKAGYSGGCNARIGVVVRYNPEHKGRAVKREAEPTSRVAANEMRPQFVVMVIGQESWPPGISPGSGGCHGGRVGPGAVVARLAQRWEATMRPV